MQSKKQSKPLLALGFLIAGCLWLKPHQIYAYSGGDGTEGNPYLISSNEELNQLRIEVNGGNTYANTYFRLTENLDLEGFDDDGNNSNGNFTPIGTSSSPFKGYFDGGQHTISNMKIAQQYVAFFNYKTDGWVKNLVLENVNLKSTYGTSSLAQTSAGLILYATNTAIEQVGILGGSISGCIDDFGFVGGLVTQALNTQIKDSYVQANLNGARVGG